MNAPAGIIELRKGRYISAFFHVDRFLHQDGGAVDFIGAVYSDDEQRRDWTVRGRFRFYEPNHHGPFDNEDRKLMVGRTVQGDEAEALEKMRELVASGLTLLGGTPAPVEEIEVKLSGIDGPIEIIKKQPWAHYREERLS